MPIQLESYLNFRTIYLLAVTSLSLYLLMRGLVVIRKEKRKRLRLAKDMDYSEAVIPPETQEDDDGEKILKRRRAVQSIETRFEFMRRFYIPLIVFISGLLLSLPFLPTMPATYLSLFTGLVAGLIGLASRPVIENAIAGMVLTFSQPLRINDTVIIDGQYGTVEKINLLHTIIKVWNWRRLVVPNNKLLQKEIENLTLGEEDEWAYVAFYVEPHVDIEKLKKIAKKAMNSRYLDDKEDPSFWIMDMGKDSILCWVAGWATDPARAWALKSSARRNLIAALQKNNISFHMANTNINVNPQQLNFKTPEPLS